MELHSEVNRALSWRVDGRRLTIKRIAKKAGVGEATVHAIKSNPNHDLRSSTANRIAEALKDFEQSREILERVG